MVTYEDVLNRWNRYLDYVILYVLPIPRPNIGYIGPLDTYDSDEEGIDIIMQYLPYSGIQKNERYCESIVGNFLSTIRKEELISLYDITGEKEEDEGIIVPIGHETDLIAYTQVFNALKDPLGEFMDTCIATYDELKPDIFFVETIQGASASKFIESTLNKQDAVSKDFTCYLGSEMLQNYSKMRYRGLWNSIYITLGLDNKELVMDLLYKGPDYVKDHRESYQINEIVNTLAHQINPDEFQLFYKLYRTFMVKYLEIMRPYVAERIGSHIQKIRISKMDDTEFKEKIQVIFDEENENPSIWALRNTRSNEKVLAMINDAIDKIKNENRLIIVFPWMDGIMKL